MRASERMERIRKELTARSGISRNEAREHEFVPRYMTDKVLMAPPRTIIDIEADFIHKYREAYYFNKQQNGKKDKKYILDLIVFIEEFIAELSRSPSCHNYLGLDDEDMDLWISKIFFQSSKSEITTLSKQRELGHFIKLFDLYVSNNDTSSHSKHTVMKDFIYYSFPAWYKNHESNFVSDTYIKNSYNYFNEKYFFGFYSYERYILHHKKELLKITSSNNIFYFNSAIPIVNNLFYDFLKDLKYYII